MSQLSITLTHTEYQDLDLALKIKHDEYTAAMCGVDSRAAVVIRARQSIGMSMERRHLFYDYDPERDEPKLTSCWIEQ